MTKMSRPDRSRGRGSSMQSGQKIWMWIFIAMFAVPEILFSFVLSFVDFLGKNITPLYSFFVPYHFFIDHPIYLLTAEVVELLGVLGLFVLSLKSKKKLLAIILAIILLWIVVNLYMGFVVSTMNLIF